MRPIVKWWWVRDHSLRNENVFSKIQICILKIFVQHSLKTHGIRSLISCTKCTTIQREEGFGFCAVNWLKEE